MGVISDLSHTSVSSPHLHHPAGTTTMQPLSAHLAHTRLRSIKAVTSFHCSRGSVEVVEDTLHFATTSQNRGPSPCALTLLIRKPCRRLHHLADIFPSIQASKTAPPTLGAAPKKTNLVTFHFLHHRADSLQHLPILGTKPAIYCTG